MSLWTQEEFEEASGHTKLSERTRSACQKVLVEGVTGAEAGRQFHMPPAQVSRGVTILRQRHAEFQAEVAKAVETQRAVMETFKSAAVQAARKIAGINLVIHDAQHGNKYEGVGIVLSEGFFVQRSGRSGVVHDLGKLTKIPSVDAHLVIVYPKNGGLASVVEKREIGRDRDGSGVER